MLQRFIELATEAAAAGLHVEIFPLRDFELTEEQNELQGYTDYRAELYVNQLPVGTYSSPDLLHQAIQQHKGA